MTTVLRTALFVLFVAHIVLPASGRRQAATGVFLPADPLLALTGGLASGAVWWGMLAAIALCAVTAVFGRFFCGWACPLGALLDWVGAGMRRLGLGGHPVGALVAWRYALLILVIASAAVGGSLAYWVDPLCLMTRTVGFAGYPSITRSVPATLATALGGRRIIADPALALAVLLPILACEVVARRFWCRALCPLGALLSLSSRFSLRKRTVLASCNSCGQCVAACPAGAIPDTDPKRTSRWECIQCETCRRLCPGNAVSFGLRRATPADPVAAEGLSRRGFMRAAALGTVAGGAGLAGGFAAARDPFDDGLELIRPPGSLPEATFLKRCIRCGDCIAVCPTNTLQPARLGQGLHVFWTPTPAMRIAGCDPACNACGRACPTGAVRRLPPDERRAVRIGMAEIDRESCLPWSAVGPCDVCVRECAHQGYNAIATDNAGRPRVISHLCTGCGWCEFRCPVGKGNNRPPAKAAVIVGAQTQDRIAEGSYRDLRERERAGAVPPRADRDRAREFLPGFLRPPP